MATQIEIQVWGGERFGFYRHSSHNREFHNVNERKTVQTNMISFVSHGDKTLQRLVGMPGEQEHHISSVPFFFS